MSIKIGPVVYGAILTGGLFAAWSFGLLPVLRASQASQRPTAPAVPVVAKAASSGTFVVKTRTIGFVEPMAQVVVRTRIDSQVLTQNVLDGATVRAGDVLFTLDDRELRAQIARDEAQVLKDRATIARTEADLKRKLDLMQKGAGTPQAYDQALADDGVAKATLAADEAALMLDRTKLDYTVIRAPISGRLGAVAVTPGNLVKTTDAGSGLVTITQVDPIRISMQLSEREFGNIQTLVSQNAAPDVTIYQSATSTILAKGKVSFLDSAIDVTSGTVTVKAEFPNAAAKLWPGMFVDADVTTRVFPNATIVPTVSVQTGPNGTFAFVVKPDQTVAIRPVSIAAFDGTSAAVQSGLAEGDRVVVEGQGRLASGSKISEGLPAAKATASNGVNG